MTEMTPAEAVFFAAAALPAADRAAYLDRACAGNDDLRRQVERMLAARAEVGDFLEPRQALPSSGATATFAPDPSGRPGGATATFGHGTDGSPTASFAGRDEHVGSVIAGKYKLMEEIGEGGMGSVFMAQQTEPVKRPVAVKVIKAGMDSKAVVARFDAERQALALMDHPNIAKVLDGGTTESGRPFFVMELVKGVPITQFCDDRKLGVRERLELFVPVCQAIQHAHQKGIIHRDIKPSNVLIALYDDKPVPKVIDFGIAKAAGQSLTDHTLMTGFGAVVGTPEYMSPEQASLNNLDIDTRSDVYALGVLLYELLTGTTPVDRESLGKAAILEILRVVREVDVPRPSAKLSTIDTLPSVAARRGTEPARLAKMMRGELDWVLLKALEKDRTRRYESANGFAADLQRYLDGEAVQAHPPSAAYRLKKLVRRNKAQVIAASLVLFLLLAGIAGTTFGMIQAKRSAAAERQAKLEAEANLAYAKKGNEILGSVFANLDPRAKYATIAELRNALKANLIDAAKKLDDLGSGDPLAVAEMRHTLGTSLQSLGETELALPFFQQAMEARKAHLGADHPDTLASASSLAGCLLVVRGADQALPLIEETLKLRTEKLGPDHPDTLRSMNQLALWNSLSAMQDLTVPPDSIGKGDENQVNPARARLKFDRALSLWEKSLELGKQKLAPDHPERLACMYALAFGYTTSSNKKHQVQPLLEELLPLQKKRLGPGHPDTIATMDLLATHCGGDRGLALREEALAATKARLGVDHPTTLGVMVNLVQAYGQNGKNELAVTIQADLLRLLTVKYGPDNPTVLGTTLDLAERYLKAKREPEALHLYRGYFDQMKKQLASAPTEVAVGLTLEASTLLSHKVYPMAEQFLRECLAIREKHDPGDWTLFDTQALLGGALLGQKKYAEAEPLLVKGYLGMRAREKNLFEGRTKPIFVPINDIERRIPEALDRLIELYTATNKPDEVKKYRDLRAKYPDPMPSEKK